MGSQNWRRNLWVSHAPEPRRTWKNALSFVSLYYLCLHFFHFMESEVFLGMKWCQSKLHASPRPCWWYFSILLWNSQFQMGPFWYDIDAIIVTMWIHNVPVLPALDGAVWAQNVAWLPLGKGARNKVCLWLPSSECEKEQSVFSLVFFPVGRVVLT